MILLDTDHFSVLSDECHAANRRLFARLQSVEPQVVATTAVGVEEQMAGWIAWLRKQRSLARQASGYERLIGLVRFLEQ